MSASNEIATRSRCPGWVKLLLILSLAVNLVVAGVVIGHKFRGDHKRDRRGGDRVTEWIIDMVPEERREFARGQLSDLPNRLESERAARMAQLPEIVAAMTAEPFDPAALETALTAMSDRHVLRQSVISLLEALTPAERAEFAESFSKKLNPRGRRGGA